MNINPKDSKFTIDVDLVEVDNSVLSFTGYAYDIKFYFYHVEDGIY